MPECWWTQMENQRMNNEPASSSLSGDSSNFWDTCYFGGDERVPERKCSSLLFRNRFIWIISLGKRGKRQVWIYASGKRRNDSIVHCREVQSSRGNFDWRIWWRRSRECSKVGVINRRTRLLCCGDWIIIWAFWRLSESGTLMFYWGFFFARGEKMGNASWM